MNRRQISFAITFILGCLTIGLAIDTISDFRAGRQAAHDRLPQLQEAADGTLAALVDEASAVLQDWDGTSPVAAPLQRAETFATSSASEGTLPASGGAQVAFHAHALEVLWLDEAGRQGRRGFVPFKTLRTRMRSTRGLGAPAAPLGGQPGRYSRLQLVRADGTVVWSLGPPPPESSLPAGDVADMLTGGGHATRAQLDIAKELASDGTEYKDEDGEKTLGAWRPTVAVPDLWVIVEVQDAAATFGVAGLSLREIGLPIDNTLYGWHLPLALTVISLLISAFFAVQKRGLEMKLLLRVFGFVRPYRSGVVITVSMGIAFTALNMAVKVFFSKQLVDVLVSQPADAESTLWSMGISVCVIAVAIAGLGYGRQYLFNWYTTAIMSDIRYAIGLKIASLPLSFFHRMRAGDLVARIERDAASMRKVFSQAFGTAAVHPFQLAFAVVFAFMTSWRLALVLIGMPIIVYPLFRIAKRIKKRAEKRQELAAEISHVIFQLLIGIKVVKAFGGEEREALRLRDAINRFIAQARRIHRLSATSDALLDLLQLIGAAIVMVGGGFLVLAGTVTVGEITAFLVIIQQIYKSSKQLTTLANNMVDAAPGVRRVFEVLDAESDIVDGSETLPKRALTQGIRFADVSFAYGEKRVLTHVDLEIPAGKVVAVVGPTGAGKTTLCDLVARFYDPTEGGVLYDGQDIRRYTLKSLLQSVAIVTQDAFLFNATIAENILYGNPDATAEQMRAAASDAFVHDEIERMEGRYQKLAGERGASVSGGQRQRITIARAILKDAPVLILDEATSALDSHAEKQVQAALDKLMRGRTVIVVAHRLSTIRNADRVVVMADGRVIEQGPPDELLQRDGGHFRRMYELQMGAAGAADAARAAVEQFGDDAQNSPPADDDAVDGDESDADG